MKFIKSILQIQSNHLSYLLMGLVLTLSGAAFAEGTQGEFPPAMFEQELDKKDKTPSAPVNTGNIKPQKQAATQQPSALQPPSQPPAQRVATPQPRQPFSTARVTPRLGNLPRQLQAPRAHLPRQIVPGFTLPRQLPGGYAPVAPLAPRQPINNMRRPMPPYPVYQGYPGRIYAPYGANRVPMRPMAYPAPNYNYLQRYPNQGGYAPNPYWNNNTTPRSPTVTPAPSSKNAGQPTNAGQSLYPMRKKIVRKQHAWGKERNIWPDFYTNFTEDLWDSMINAPSDVGRMPGGWKAPSFTSPDPVTIGDAVTNQMPPMAEEMGNMTDFTD